METLKSIFKDLDKENGKEFHSWESAKIFYQRFDSLFQEWVKECKNGKMKSTENISSIIESELIRRKEIGERRAIKKQNSFEIILQFQDKLRYLQFEIAKTNKLKTINECECELRLLYRIEPKMENLERYGTACLYHIEENYRIHKCKICKTKWIDGDYRWKEWDSKEYILKDTLNKK